MSEDYPGISNPRLAPSRETNVVDIYIYIPITDFTAALTPSSSHLFCSRDLDKESSRVRVFIKKKEKDDRGGVERSTGEEGEG